MGWGGRLVGAYCSRVPKYVGIDNNKRLKTHLEKMKDTLTSRNDITFTKIELLNEDCLTVDYSQYEYDMVFTSPPYYNKELYGSESVARTEEEWETEFYIPIFRKTWTHLLKGGRYCLNIPAPLYEKICVPMLGEATEQIELNKFSRTIPKRETVRKNIGDKYKEYIYVWIKG